MRPTFSIICFTVLSGAGYGLWFLVGIALTWRHCGPQQPGDAVATCMFPIALTYALIVGFVLVSAGLLSSLAHLGQPQRAWRALSQWRSSWLSREGVAAIATYLPALALLAWGLAPLPFDVVATGTFALASLAGIALAVGAALTVYCTAHIYSSLKPIRAWGNRWVVPGYLLLGLYSGALCLWVLATWPASTRMPDAAALLGGLVALSAACVVLKSFYWRQIDVEPAIGAGHAIGLASLGSVRSFEAPHTEENYLTHEMGFVLARKHARKLRRIALISGFLVPALLALLALAVPAFGTPAAWLALASGFGGLFVERWLFFAEAKHAVMAYYAR